MGYLQYQSYLGDLQYQSYLGDLHYQSYLGDFHKFHVHYCVRLWQRCCPTVTATKNGFPKC
jgi:hypothetical protein